MKYALKQWIAWCCAWLCCTVLPLVANARTPCPAPGSASHIAVSVTPEPSVLVFDATRQKATGSLVVAAEGISFPELTLLPQPLVLGNNHAFLRFVDAPNDQYLSLGDPRAHCGPGTACRVSYEVLGVTTHGTYTGPVEVTSACGKLASATVSALFDIAQFRVSLTSDWLKNDRLEFDATENRSVTLTVTAAASTPQRAYRISARAARIEPTTRHWWDQLVPNVSHETVCYGVGPDTTTFFSPASFVLDGGASQPVVVTVPSCLARGSYIGLLQVSDSANPALSLAAALSIKKTATTDERRLQLLLWVTLGAISSLLINNIFPLYRVRQERFGALRNVQLRIDACVSISSALRTFLASEARRLWLLIAKISFLDPGKDVTLASVTQSAEMLSKLVKAAEAINGLRSEADLLQLPIRTQLLVDVQLQRADDALIQGDVGSAEGFVATANQMVRTEPTTEALRAQLKTDIDKLVRERGNFKPKLGRPNAIQNRINQLKQDAQGLTDMSKAELIAVERDYYIADTWTDVFEFAARSGDVNHFAPLVEPLCEVLAASPAAPDTQHLLTLIKSGVSPIRLEEALKASGGAQIQCDKTPRYFELVDFHFMFTELALASLPSAQAILKYRWEFDDGTAAPDAGATCKHFFLPAARSWQFWKSTPKPGLNLRHVKLTVTLPIWGEPHELGPEKLHMRAPEDHRASVWAMQFATFVITTLVAVLAAFGAQYTGGALPATIDWGAGITAFLFGFGIDQLRAKTAGK